MIETDEHHLRAFVDGPPTADMVQCREAVRDLLTPRHTGRWGVYGEADEDRDARDSLFRAAYEAGYDGAVSLARRLLNA